MHCIFCVAELASKSRPPPFQMIFTSAPTLRSRFNKLELRSTGWVQFRAVRVASLYRVVLRNSHPSSGISTQPFHKQCHATHTRAHTHDSQHQPATPILLLRTKQKLGNSEHGYGKEHALCRALITQGVCYKGILLHTGRAHTNITTSWNT